MASKRSRGRKPLVRRYELPPLVRVFLLPCSEQMAIYHNAASQLVPSFRGELKRRGVLPFEIDVLEVYLIAIRDHWDEQRRLCQNNPDYFTWPSTAAWLGDGGFLASGLDEDGALSLFGYRVSREADLSDEERRSKLDVVFQAVIPPFTHWFKVLEWGEPKSAVRLKKMANCLAAFARNGSRQTGERMSVPVEKWKEDLAYLRLKYYERLFGFDWPDPEL